MLNCRKILKKTFKEASQKIIQTKGLDKEKVIVMVQDEGRFGRVNVPRNTWAPLGVRPVVGRQVVREAFYAYTAVCPALGKSTSLILPYANTSMMNIFLKQVYIDFIDYEIIMQVDGAGWHKSKNLEIPDNIHFVVQPPYSPETNAVEHIWDDIKEKELHNECFDKIENAIDAVCKGLKRLNDNPEYLSSLTNFPHLNILQ